MSEIQNYNHVMFVYIFCFLQIASKSCPHCQYDEYEKWITQTSQE